MDKDALKKALTPDLIVKILQEVGAFPHDVSSEELIYCTELCHGGDSNKLHYYDNTKLFVCYTQCGNLDIYSLLDTLFHKRGTPKSFTQILRFVAEVAGLELSEHTKKM